MQTISITANTTALDCNKAVEKMNGADDVLLLLGKHTLDDEHIKELHNCLYAVEKHAIVCRLKLNDDTVIAARECLPKYIQITKPTATCALIKRRVIDSLGFLDPGIGNVQSALEDFHRRINAFGYTAVASCYAAHAGGTDDIDRDVGMHQYLKLIRLLADKTGKRKILFDCAMMPPYCTGTSEYQISLFDAFSKIYSDKYDIYLYTTREADTYHKLSAQYGRVLYPDTIGDEVFHLGFVPNQLYFPERQVDIGRRSLKIIQTVHDIIALRCFDHKTDDLNHSDVMRMGLGLCDAIITISEYSKQDLQAFFCDTRQLEEIPVKVIYVGFNETKCNKAQKKDYALPFEEFFLVIGNAYKHKALKETVEVLKELKCNFIVVGYGKGDYIYGNIYGYESGYLKNDFLDYLYAKCKAVIFPSLYEGFGLPVVIGLRNNKRIIAANTQLNRELREKYSDFYERFLLFDKFEQIGDIIESIDFKDGLEPVAYEDTWDRAAIEAEGLFEQVLNSETDTSKLYERLITYNVIGSITRSKNALETGERELTSQFDNYRLLTLLKSAIKLNIKHRHPKLFAILKGNRRKKPQN